MLNSLSSTSQQWDIAITPLKEGASVKFPNNRDLHIITPTFRCTVATHTNTPPPLTVQAYSDKTNVAHYTLLDTTARSHGPNRIVLPLSPVNRIGLLLEV